MYGWLFGPSEDRCDMTGWPDKTKLRAYSAVAGREIDLVGDWMNELGSVLRIEEVAGGRVGGRYRSRVSEGRDPVEGPLVGHIATDSIGFVASWTPRYPAITTWAGKALATPDGEPFLYCLWTLSRGLRDPAEWWESHLTGADMFRRGAD